ncbi:MAG: extracellular solute-binding protein [Planctomycetota bacterium]
MAIRPRDVETGMSSFQKFGLAVAGVFYVASVLYVHFLGPAKVEFEPGVTVLHMAHWEMAAGFREGIDEMIRRFEEVKANDGVKVRVLQTTIPRRGYLQWMITQLVSGEPADILENSEEGELRDLYFTGLSPYIGKPNPFNHGTPLEGMPWKDTFIDNMEGAFDILYADYYGLGLSFFTKRLHVNLDLVEKATGSRRMPEDFTEWMEICRQLKEYGERIGEPVIPIGVEGMRRSTLNDLFYEYFSQLNGNLQDEYSRFCDGFVRQVDMIKCLKKKGEEADRLLAVMDLLREMGQYFMKGFVTADEAQTTYLFHQGMVAFFPATSAESYSLKANSDFDLGIVPFPPIGYRHKYSKYFTGRTTESGVKVEGPFGIPKATRHFDLALELLQFMTSWEIDQMVMDHCKWAPGVKQAEYTDFMKAFQPYMGGNLRIWDPYRFIWDNRAHRKKNEVMEEIIQKNIPNPQEFFLRQFHEYSHYIVEEIQERLEDNDRANLMREGRRSQLMVGLGQTDLAPQDRVRVNLRKELVQEDFAERIPENFVYAAMQKELRDF